MGQVELGGRRVGPGNACFVIAEAGVNHNGDLDLARELVRVAARAGADAVKFQTFSAVWTVLLKMLHIGENNVVRPAIVEG